MFVCGYCAGKGVIAVLAVERVSINLTILSTIPSTQPIHRSTDPHIHPPIHSIR